MNTTKEPVRKLVNARLSPEDFYYTPTGLMVFTETYHLKRGYCCQSNCRHCAYGFKKK